MEVQIENDKIFAPLKGKWLVLKPEEEVRQTYICRLVDYYGYRLSQMDQEIQVNNSQRGQGMARADIVIWRNEQDKSDHKTPLIVVECKAENVTIRQADYFQGYNYAGWAGADFFVTTNLKETRIFKVDKSKMPKELDEIADIPKADIANDRKKIQEILKKNKEFTREEFKRLLMTCHNIIRNNDKLSPEAAFDEISKILLSKYATNGRIPRLRFSHLMFSRKIVKHTTNIDLNMSLIFIRNYSNRQKMNSRMTIFSRTLRPSESEKTASKKLLRNWRFTICLLPAMM